MGIEVNTAIGYPGLVDRRDLADQLRLKQKLMFDHWHDLDDVLTGKKPPVE